MTQSDQMRRRSLVSVILLAALVGGVACAQDFRVYTEHPRLFLQSRRLKLLERERERESTRWQRFEALIKSGVALPEPGFAKALYSRVAGDAGACVEAVDWALGDASDLRQLALVFDWCQPQLTGEKSRALSAKLVLGSTALSSDSGIPAIRDRVLAAIALADHSAPISEQQLRRVVEQWWRGRIVPALLGGREAIPRDDMLALLEILHAVRDNLMLDLREAAPEYFRDLPPSLLLGYYPSPHPATEDEFFIPAVKGGGQPDLRRAALARAADLSLVAYDTNSGENQYLQGWLTRDPYMMRSPFGVVYEFLWANPYQPGLSYYHFPLFFHNNVGSLFARSSWNDDATWLGYLGGELQVFDSGGLKIVTDQPASKPIRLGDVAIYMLSGAPSSRIDPPGVEMVFLLGLRPKSAYTVEVEGDKRREEMTDSGGILSVSIAEKPGAWIRIREASRPD